MVRVSRRLQDLQRDGGGRELWEHKNLNGHYHHRIFVIIVTEKYTTYSWEVGCTS